MPDARGPEEEAARRARVREMVSRALEAGEPTAWFDELYGAAGGDPALVPWADLGPHPCLEAFASRPGALEGVRRVVVVGCGLGHDAEYLARAGLEVLAFDVAPRAVAWARRLHAGSSVRYEVGDLLDPPAAWRSAFDLVVEVYTLQALPSALRSRAAAGLRALAAPAGRVFVTTRLRAEGEGSRDERVVGPPWPLTRRELSALMAPFTLEGRLEETPEPKDPTLTQAYGAWRRSG